MCYIDYSQQTTSTATTTPVATTKKEQKTAEQIRRDKDRAAHEELVHPSRRLVHKLFLFISFLTAVVALCLVVGQILAIIYESDGPIQYTLNGFLILCCFLIFFNELQWTILTRDSAILGHWVTRGLFYAFIGVICVEQNDQTFQAGQTRHNNEHAYNVSMAYIKAVAYIIIGCGALYFIMGMFCLHRVYNSYVKDYGERTEMAKRIQRAGGGSVATPTDVETG